MRVAIVGSRRRATLTDRKIVMQLVEDLIREFGDDLVLVSGACPKGADDFAAQASRIYKVPIEEFPIDRSTSIENRGEFTRRAYARNRQVAERCERAYCLVHPDRTGGTENTVGHLRELKRDVYIVDPSGKIYLDVDADGKADSEPA